MLRSGASLLRSLHSRTLCTSSSSPEKIVASVVFERLPLVVPKIHPALYAFQLFSFRWGKVTGKKKRMKKGEEEQPTQPEQVLVIPESVAKGDYELEFKQIPWRGNADKSNNRRSPMRSLDKRLYLLLYGCPYGTPSTKPVWHFPEKLYESEVTLRQCAESALKATIGDLAHANFIGRTPIGHLAVHGDDESGIQPFKRFFFKSQVLGLNKFTVENCEDHAWVTKHEMMEYFPDQAHLFRRMIIG